MLKAPFLQLSAVVVRTGLPPGSLCFPVHSALYYSPDLLRVCSKSSCRSGNFSACAVWDTWCHEDRTSDVTRYHSFHPLFFKPTRKKKGAELSQRYKWTRKRALLGSPVDLERILAFQLLSNSQNLANSWAIRSSHLQDSNEWQGTKVGSREGKSYFCMMPRKLRRPSKDVKMLKIPRLLGYGKILVEISR